MSSKSNQVVGCEFCKKGFYRYRNLSGNEIVVGHMKRLFAISLMLVFLTFSAGVVVAYHFCGGKLAEISVFNGTKSCCPDAGSQKSCCRNSTLTLKITNDYSSDITFPEVPSAKVIAILQNVFSYTEISVFKQITKQMFDTHEINRDSKLPIYLTNQVFII